MMINFSYVNSLDHSWKLGSSTWLLMYWLRSSLQSIMCVISHMVQDQYSCLPFFCFLFFFWFTCSFKSFWPACELLCAIIGFHCAWLCQLILPFGATLGYGCPPLPKKKYYRFQYFIANALSPWKWKLLGLFAVTFLTSWCAVFAWCIAIWWFWNDIWIKNNEEICSKLTA